MNSLNFTLEFPETPIPATVGEIQPELPDAAEPQIEIEPLSDALLEIRERNKINRQGL